MLYILDSQEAINKLNPNYLLDKINSYLDPKKRYIIHNYIVYDDSIGDEKEKADRELMAIELSYDIDEPYGIFELPILRLYVSPYNTNYPIRDKLEAMSDEDYFAAPCISFFIKSIKRISFNPTQHISGPLSYTITIELNSNCSDDDRIIMIKEIE